MEYSKFLEEFNEVRTSMIKQQIDYYEGYRKKLFDEIKTVNSELEALKADYKTQTGKDYDEEQKKINEMIERGLNNGENN